MLFVIKKRQLILSCFFVLIFLLSVGIFNHAKEETIKKPDGNIIVIDAGHGGMDGGAVGTTGILEKDINLSIAKKLQKIAETNGKKVIMTRTDDQSLSTTDSAKIRNQKRSDLEYRKNLLEENSSAIFISIHLNKFPQESVKGAQVFYANNDKSRSLANIIQKSIKNNIDAENNRVTKPSPENIYIFKNCKSTAIIVECGFLSNIQEEKLLSTEKYQQKIAEAIYKGIYEFIKS